MRALPIGAALAVLSFGVAAAQTAPTAPAQTSPTNRSTTTLTGSGTGGAPTANNGATTNPGGAVLGNGGPAAASGNNNQAVATTNANAPQPAKGHNSFTQGQAKTRIGRQGFQNVSALTLDNNGVWRGTAQKDGQSVNVWLDYKGNVGTSQQ